MASPALLTFLFTDLESSTRLWQKYPQAMNSVLARHDDLIRSSIEERDGWVVKTTGDGFHAAFASPLDGLQACILAQQKILGETWDATGPLRVRMGLHSGEAQEREGDYYGTAVNRAARLMSAANGGQVLLSAAATQLVADDLPEGVNLRDLGEHRLKDLLRPEHIFQLLYPGLPDNFPEIVSLNQRPNNLPTQTTLLVGREIELNEIRDMLVADQVRLVTLTGPGGTGKTRLALQIGAELSDRFQDGTYFIDLAPIREPESVMTTIARTIGLKESANGSMLEDLKDQLQDKRMLLLLDNFEQVLSAALPVSELLRFCPHLKLLTTSREALHLRGEHLFPVPPLGIPGAGVKHLSPDQLIQYEAVQLFVDRARTVKPGFDITEDNAAAIAELCLKLDGLPLAIELAAARIRIFSAQALLERLESRLKLLRGGARDLPERQQTLRDTIDWSYELLTEQEKILFKVFSVFSSSTFEAVEAVISRMEHPVAAEIDIFDGLVSLVDKSLIRQSADDPGEPRLQMLGTIREYAAERSQADPDLNHSARQAHAAYYADFAWQQWQRMTGNERDDALQAMADEVDNLLIAWRYWSAKKDLEQLQKMVNSLWLLYDGRGWYQATIELTTDLLEILSTTPTSPEQAQQVIMLQTSLARALMAIKGYTEEVEQAYNVALKLSEQYGEVPLLFPVLRSLSSFYMYRAEFDKGLKIGERILELAEREDDDYLRVHAYLVIGANTGFMISYEQGLEILEKGIALFEKEMGSFQPFQLGNNPGIVCYTSSAFFLYWLGCLDRGVEKANRAIELAGKLQHPFTLAYALFHTGSLHLWRGEMEIVRDRAHTMLELAEEHGFQIWISLARMLQGSAQMVLGEPEAGLDNIERGFAIYQGLKSPPLFYPQLIAMRALALAQAGRPEEGLQLVEALLNEVGEEQALKNLPPHILLKGDLLLAVSPENRAQAAEIYWTLLSNQIGLGGKTFRLQTATRLCRLELLEGDASRSGKLLAEIYDSFSEGFDTADLQAAKAVLEQWRE